MNPQELQHRMDSHLTTATEQLIALVDDVLRAWHECLDTSCCQP
jgi:hypothetical protein